MSVHGGPDESSDDGIVFLSPPAATRRSLDLGM